MMMMIKELTNIHTLLQSRDLNMKMETAKKTNIELSD